MTEQYLIVTYDNVLSSPFGIPAWDPNSAAPPLVCLLDQAQRFTDPVEAMNVVFAVLRAMGDSPLWSRTGLPELAVVTEAEAEMLTRVSQRMCNLVMRRT